MHRQRNTLLAIASLLCVGTAIADVGPDVTVRFLTEPGQLPQLGEVFRFELELVSANTVQASEPRLISGRTTAGSDDWEILNFPLPPEFQLNAGVPLSFSVDLLCNDPSEPFSVQMSIDGQSLYQSFYPLPQSVDLTYGGPDSGPESDKIEVKLPDVLPLSDDRALPPVEPGKVGETVQVSGKFVFIRNAHDNDGNSVGDGTKIGADGVSAYLYLKTQVGDVAVASQAIGPNGNYSMSLYNPFAGKPSFYVQFRAGNSRVHVDIPGTGLTWYWNTPVTWNFTGTSKNYGTIGR